MVDWQMHKRSKIEDPGALPTGGLILRSSGLVLLSLLLLYSFAQAHLIKLRPFRATDTDLSGGDHICDLRRDSNGDGKPDRLGDYVKIRGTVIAEPSTYEIGGWLFWIRDDACGILIYGEPENLSLGDLVEVYGCVRLTNGNYFFPETGLATLGDTSVENMGVTLLGKSSHSYSVDIEVSDFTEDPARFGGNLITLSDLVPSSQVYEDGDDRFVWFYHDEDSVLIYIDGDTSIEFDPNPSTMYSVSGIVVRMKLPSEAGSSPSWTLAPRYATDIVEISSPAGVEPVSWGNLKSGFAHED